MAEEISHYYSSARVEHPHAKIKVLELPFLASLSFNFGILEGAFNERARATTKYTCKHCAILKSAQAWNRFAKFFVLLHACIYGLKGTELD